MPRYYFDLKSENADFDLDSEGVILNDMDAAEQEAFRAMGDLLRERLAHVKPVTFVIQVRNEAGHPVIETSVTLRHQLIHRN